MRNPVFIAIPLTDPFSGPGNVPLTGLCKTEKKARVLGFIGVFMGLGNRDNLNAGIVPGSSVWQIGALPTAPRRQL